MPRMRTGPLVSGDALAMVRCMRRQLRYDEDTQRQRLRCAVGWQYVRKVVLKVSKRRAAALCGVSRATVDRWEDPLSDSLPDIGHIGALCSALDVDVREVVIIFGVLHNMGK